MSKNMIANRYDVFQHIGQGGMADVFLAMDTILNRQVAVKILRSELCADAVAVLRFEREAQAATALSHPNIVEIYDVGEYKGHQYIVMEYVPGKTLKQIIRDRGALLKEEAVDIMKQLVSGTAEAHRRGIIHRDIKPQNVIVRSDGSIKILDFGIALAKGSMQLTQANNVMGSVHYLAPEIARGESASVQSDIYSLGIVLYEMLTGDVPFKADTAVQVALMQMRNQIPDVRSVNPDVPQSLANVIARATAKNKAYRYRSCPEMLDDLRTCLNPERLNEPKYMPGASQATASIAFDELPEEKEKKKKNRSSSPAQEPARKRAAVKKNPRTNKVLVALLIILLLLLAAAGVYYALGLSGILEPVSRYTTVPDILGMTLTEAKDVCTENELVLDTANVTYELTENIEKGKIYAVVPEVSEEVEKGSEVRVSISSGIGVTVGDYRGTKIEDAVGELAQKHPNIKVTVEAEEPAEDDERAPGTVIRQELLEPYATVNRDAASEMKLVYLAYPTIIIPENIEGMAIDEATAILEEMGTIVYTSTLDTTNMTAAEIANLPTGIVIKVSPDAGSEYTQTRDNFITIYYYGY
ncbi:MAG: Stk1 family PASTA domain-containing Ser/Thr kinase [Solobacterium sp.]|nr:Stk1 family PASTA domain-containing Ser/Thr kinase [Solobacterium sp.]